MGWIIIIAVLVVLGIAMLAGFIMLQVFLSKKENKFLGLILPLLALSDLIQSFYLMDIESLLSPIITEVVLLGIYFSCRKKYNSNASTSQNNAKTNYTVTLTEKKLKVIAGLCIALLLPLIFIISFMSYDMNIVIPISFTVGLLIYIVITFQDLKLVLNSSVWLSILSAVPLSLLSTKISPFLPFLFSVGFVSYTGMSIITYYINNEVKPVNRVEKVEQMKQIEQPIYSNQQIILVQKKSLYKHATIIAIAISISVILIAISYFYGNIKLDILGENTTLRSILYYIQYLPLIFSAIKLIDIYARYSAYNKLYKELSFVEKEWVDNQRISIFSK